MMGFRNAVSSENTMIYLKIMNCLIMISSPKTMNYRKKTMWKLQGPVNKTRSMKKIRFMKLSGYNKFYENNVLYEHDKYCENDNSYEQDYFCKNYKSSEKNKFY